MKIYLATESDYSYFSVNAIFETREEADVYVSLYGGDVEEMETGVPGQKNKDEIYYHVWFNNKKYKAGETHPEAPQDWSENKVHPDCTGKNSHSVTCWAKSPEEAKQIATKLRLDWLESLKKKKGLRG